MAGTTTKSLEQALPGSACKDTTVQFNKLIADVELLRAAIVAIATKLDADAGVTDTNYAAGATLAAIDTAAELTAALVGNGAGTAIS